MSAKDENGRKKKIYGSEASHVCVSWPGPMSLDWPSTSSRERNAAAKDGPEQRKRDLRRSA